MDGESGKMSITDKLIIANKKIKELEKDINQINEVHLTDIRELQATIDHLKLTLEHYANENNWIDRGVFRDYVPFKRAQVALKKI